MNDSDKQQSLALVNICTKSKLIKYIINILFGISTTCMNFMLIDPKITKEIAYIILPIVTFIISQILVFKFKFLEKTFENKNKTILFFSIFLGIFASWNMYTKMEYKVLKDQMFIFVIMAIPAISVFLYWFYNKLIYYFKRYVKTLDKIEKNYLIIASTILIISILVIYNLTNLFYSCIISKEKYDYELTDLKTNQNMPEENEDTLYKMMIRKIYDKPHYDVVYTSDTGWLYLQDAYTNVVSQENNLRQPLFGVFAIPFSIIPRLLADIIPSNNLYAILMAIMQGVLIFIAFTLLARMMKLKGIAKGLFLSIISLTYPTLLFLLNLEQYCIPVFYLITFIYFSVNKINEDKEMMYIATAGNMLTFGVFFPFLGERKNIKQSIKNIFCTFCICLAIFIVTAKVALLFYDKTEDEISALKKYSVSEHSPIEKFNMYTNFVKNNIIFSKFKEDKNTIFDMQLDEDEESAKLLIYEPAIKSMDTNKLSVIGLTIIIIAILGFILNRKDLLSKIAFIWIVFSFILHCIIGWGIPEDGLILYTLHYSWAFVCLIYKFFEKVFEKHKNIKNAIYVLIILLLTVINSYGVYELIKFGIEYFK